MSGVWGEKKEYDGQPVRTTVEDWELERIAELNRLRNERLRAEEESEDRELFDCQFGGSSKP